MKIIAEKSKLKSAYLLSVLTLFVLVMLSACQGAPSTPKDVANEFWRAIEQRDMEKAKDLSVWDTVDYLKYFNGDKFHPQRHELGEVLQGETQAEIVVTLYSSQPGKNGVKIPGKTELVKTRYGWRVDVKSTLASIARRTVDNVFEQLNKLMQKGVKELDKALSESLNEIGEALEESADKLKKELARPLDSLPDKSPSGKPPKPVSPQRQQI